MITRPDNRPPYEWRWVSDERSPLARRARALTAAGTLFEQGRCLLIALAIIGLANTAMAQQPSGNPSPPNGDPPKKERQEGETGVLAFFRQTEISGFVDVYYSYNFARPRGEAPWRNFDSRHNQFALNLVEIALERKPTEEGRLGFRLDVTFGPATETVHAAEPGGSEVFKILQQGYLSCLAPLGKGLQIDVGKFVTPHGAEVIETKDNWNYSRSFLFALAIPYYHFGVRMTYPLTRRLTVSGYLVNGWNDVVDNNGGKTFGAQVVLAPTSKLTITQNYMAGPEQADDTDDWRHLSDTSIVFHVAPSLSVMANYTYGRDRVEGARVRWQGIAAYARYRIRPWLALASRAEWYDDRDGFTTGVRQTLREITVTVEQKIAKGLLTRLEFRRDISNHRVFRNPSGPPASAQSTVTVGIVYVFTSK
jgi:hypothetical protein